MGADQNKHNYPLCSFRLTKKNRENQVTDDFDYFDRTGLFSEVHSERIRSHEQICSREFLIRCKKKCHSEDGQTLEKVAQINWNVFRDTPN